MAPREDASVPGRGPGDRLADHATIDRLAADLLPALVAQLGASGLGELEVREGSWRVRLRMPAEAAERARAIAGLGAGDPGHVQLALPDPAAAVAAAPDAAVDSPAGERPPRPAREAPADGQDEAAAVAATGETGQAAPRVVATSPAVGFFRPRPALAEGAALDAGAVLGSVDVLGVAQEVTAPAAGIVVRFFVEPGEPVEYGQEILEIGQPAAPVAPDAMVPPAATRSDVGQAPDEPPAPPVEPPAPPDGPAATPPPDEPALAPAGEAGDGVAPAPEDGA